MIVRQPFQFFENEMYMAYMTRSQKVMGENSKNNGTPTSLTTGITMLLQDSQRNTVTRPYVTAK